MTVLLTLKTVERALKYSNHSTSSKNHRCFLNFETTPEFRYLGEKQKKNEQVGNTGNKADTAQQRVAELLQGYKLLSVTLVAFMKPPKSTNFV